MKTKKILFLLAGLFNTLLGSFATFIGVISFLFNNLIKEMLEVSYEIVENYINALVEQDASNEYLLSMTESESINYVMKSVQSVCAVILIIGLIVLTFGILNLLLSKAHNNILNRKKYLGTILVVASWLLMIINIANILTTIAVYLKPKDDVSKLGLYSSKNKTEQNNT